MKKRPVIAWWGIPCKSMVPVFRALHERHEREVNFVSLQDLPPSRRRLGWKVPPTGDMPFRILPNEGWKSQIDQIVGESDVLHIVNGLYHTPRVRFLVKKLVAEERPFGVIMEAPSNLEVGLRRSVKKVALPLVTPLRTWRPARRAEFVLSASGERSGTFRWMGFRAGRIFPFGYFPDYPTMERAGANPTDVRLLCVGYLEPFKGQDCLLQAIALLRERGTQVRCTITGFGSARESLIALRDHLNLTRVVDFPGVVSQEDLFQLFSESTMLVAPGIEEPWGIRVNEGLLARLPVVVSDGVGAKEIVRSTGGGEVFQAGSAESLAEAITRALARLKPGGDLIPQLEANQDRIRPTAAADYLEQILSYGEGEVQGPTPRPLWLDVHAPVNRA